ncbi:hypothetical protein [Halorientalis marina]|uniref:hypothetical protein n=1 Tax=Halorientalis marina TaxID=2931976 RepID=UPI001FF2BB40|nr:hypothetical protein [Halorientalis marina]
MNGKRLGGSVLAGTLVFLVAAIGLTALLDPYVWPSALVALPIAVAAGVITVALTHAILTDRAARAGNSSIDGPDPVRARARLVGVVVGSVAFVVAGSAAAVVVSVGLGFSVLVALLFVALPVGLFAGVVAGLAAVTIRSGRENGSRPVT